MPCHAYATDQCTFCLGLNKHGRMIRTFFGKYHSLQSLALFQPLKFLQLSTLHDKEVLFSARVKSVFSHPNREWKCQRIRDIFHHVTPTMTASTVKIKMPSLSSIMLVPQICSLSCQEFHKVSLGKSQRV